MTDIKDKFEQAVNLANNGSFDQAIILLSQITNQTPEFADGWSLLGQVYLSDNQAKKAIECFITSCDLLPDNPWAFFNLGLAYEVDSNYEKSAKSYLRAFETSPSNARFLLFAGASFYELGKTNLALQLFSLGADMDPAVRTAFNNPKADEKTRQKSLLADTALRDFFSKLHIDSLQKVGNPERIVSSLWVQTHNKPVYYKHENHRPWVFYAPDLPQIDVFDHPKDDWCKKLEAAHNDILGEYLEFMDMSKEKHPYVDKNSMLGEKFNHLRGQDTWTAVHLYKDGKGQECIKYFPKTIAALKDAPLVYFFDKPMEVFFSVLKPKIHIPPHFGTANTRLTTHLPLIIPSDKCRIRVNNHIHYWKEGELFWFDDSWDHEAFNDSEEVRVVLIFEAWRPDMSEAEIKAVKQSFEDRHKWLMARKIPEIKNS